MEEVFLRRVQMGKFQLSLLLSCLHFEQMLGDPDGPGTAAARMPVACPGQPAPGHRGEADLGPAFRHQSFAAVIQQMLIGCRSHSEHYVVQD